MLTAISRSHAVQECGEEAFRAISFDKEELVAHPVGGRFIWLTHTKRLRNQVQYLNL